MRFAILQIYAWHLKKEQKNAIHLSNDDKIYLFSLKRKKNSNYGNIENISRNHHKFPFAARNQKPKISRRGGQARKTLVHNDKRSNIPARANGSATSRQG